MCWVGLEEVCEVAVAAMEVQQAVPKAVVLAGVKGEASRVTVRRVVRVVAVTVAAARAETLEEECKAVEERAAAEEA